jgi:hypothetical protein
VKINFIKKKKKLTLKVQPIPEEKKAQNGKIYPIYSIID